MKKILATVLAAGALLAAAPIAAATNTDLAFVMALDSEGIEYSSVNAVIEGGHAVCAMAEAGNSLPAIALFVARNADWTRSDSAYFVGAATASYCPAYAPSSNATRLQRGI